ncbi:hypothetical protein BJV78DRAFT_1151487 [Lactifluus subvellereus]|nr:hypothetical protein BJV78DRAFT_1151487 [Lactifluus subvellereus]
MAIFLADIIVPFSVQNPTWHWGMLSFIFKFHVPWYNQGYDKRVVHTSHSTNLKPPPDFSLPFFKDQFTNSLHSIGKLALVLKILKDDDLKTILISLALQLKQIEAQHSYHCPAFLPNIRRKQPGLIITTSEHIPRRWGQERPEIIHVPKLVTEVALMLKRARDFDVDKAEWYVKDRRFVIEAYTGSNIETAPPVHLTLPLLYMSSCVPVPQFHYPWRFNYNLGRPAGMRHLNPALLINAPTLDTVVNHWQLQAARGMATSISTLKQIIKTTRI